MPIKECTLPEGGAGFKWGNSGKCYADRKDAEAQAAAAHANGFAMDKSMRSVDKFGKMHVAASNISKSIVNPYRGSEIPNADGLGLDADKVYMLLRHPDELKKAASTFNNLPLLDRHIPVSAAAPAKEFIVGSTGTDATFDEPFLRNSLVIWCANSIAGIETKQQCELSSAYSYDADMTPGVYEGVAYDGIMRNIKGNHVALVEAGRAGHDIVVGDSKLLEKPEMKKGKLSAKAKTILSACLLACVGPVLAQDAQIADLTAIAGSVDSLKTAKDKHAVVTLVKKHFGDKLAQDADLSGLVDLLDALGGEEGVDLAVDDDEGLAASIAGCTPEVKAKIMALINGGAMDEDDEPPAFVKKDDDKKDDKVDKPAMDAAIAKATTDTIANMRAIQQAERDVEPHIGVLAIAQDSAENVYKLALDAAKVDLSGVPPAAYKAMVSMLPKKGSVPVVKIAQDARGGKDAFATMFPNATAMKGGA
jgi:hypothetical protein